MDQNQATKNNTETASQINDLHEQLNSSESKRHRRIINITTELPNQNAYTLALNGEFKDVAFDEVRAPKNKGQWRNRMNLNPNSPLDVEIGTGNGTHFAWYAKQNPTYGLVGLELKYKPLIQSIRRAVQDGTKNAMICRYHAFNIDELFGDGEINKLMIYFPDPWTSPNKPKNRVVNRNNLEIFHRLQQPGSIIDFKTDSREYFLWALDEIAASPYYKIVFQTFNLHQSEMAAQNFRTQFENIFLRQGIEINFVRLERKDI